MKFNWNYPTTVWVGENRINELRLKIEAIMDKSVNEKDKNMISVSKDAIIETVAEKILSQENSVNVLDANNNIVGSVKPSKIIQTVFRTGKEKS